MTAGPGAKKEKKRKKEKALRSQASSYEDILLFFQGSMFLGVSKSWTVALTFSILDLLDSTARETAGNF